MLCTAAILFCAWQATREGSTLSAISVVKKGGVVHRLIATVGFIWAIGLGLVACGSHNPHVIIKTEFGEIEVELYADKAPGTVTNFLRYVDNNKFANSYFYRTVTMANQSDNDVKIEVIQGGRFVEEGGYPPIPQETTKATGILHKDGVISMARNEPGTETSEYFICVGEQPNLDYGGLRNPDLQGFAAFGKVVHGMDVVHLIHNAPVEGQYFEPKISVINIIRK